MWFKLHPYQSEMSFPRDEFACPLSNKQYMNTASQWFESCRGNTHTQCNTYRKQHDQSLSRPSRLLYYPSDQTEKVQLVEVEMGQIYQYATLSHRWGVPEPPKLSCNGDGHRNISYETMIEGISTLDLPRIFREALEIIRHCNLEYLWIDSLCINQDNDTDGLKREWEKEAVKIGDIYTGGVFNIAAIGSRNSDGTLFPEQKEFPALVVRDYFVPRNPFLPRTFSQTGFKLVRIVPDTDSDFEIQVLSSELLSRGWVYQEVILASANLFCTAQQMWWLCHTGRYCQNHSTITPARASVSVRRGEGASLYKGREAIANPRGVSGSLKLWGELLRFYSKTSVTFKDDRLAAIAGLSRVFQSVFPRCVEGALYNSGLWSTNIIFQLSWHTISSNIAPNRFTADHFIPSWSPVSCKSELDYPHYDEQFQLPIKWTMNTSGLDNFGRAKAIDSCTLHLRGVPIEMTLGAAHDVGRNEFEVWPSAHPWSRCEILWDNQEEIDLAEKASLRTELRALILYVFEARPYWILEGILLRPSRDGGFTTPRKWVRCGYLRNYSHYPEQNEVFGDFQLTRYGITWVSDGSFSKRVSTGTAPDLEDVYLI